MSSNHLTIDDALKATTPYKHIAVTDRIHPGSPVGAGGAATLRM